MYHFVVSREGYFDAEGAVEITDHDVTMDIVMLVDDTHVPETEPLLVSAFPNPASDMLTVEAGSPIRKVRLIDITGSVVHVANVDAYRAEIQVSAFDPGIYILQVHKTNGVKTLQIQIRN